VQFSTCFPVHFIIITFEGVLIHPIDLTIFIVYLLAMLGVGFYFMRKNKNLDDYYVGGRGMNSLHIGLSVVATDVGGGFSIGLEVLVLLLVLQAAGCSSLV
jgi:solute:Na+ symporter, SSS family